ncbi:amino acid permease, partial [Escherichia coli]|uniref:amino acid permease n=1 Tax=Escherichia coli TaxID=562 RepID=UPI0027DC7F02
DCRQRNKYRVRGHHAGKQRQHTTEHTDRQRRQWHAVFRYSRKVIPVAIRTTIARLIIFFIGTVFVLAALIPMQQAGVEKSPFVLVFEKVGIPYAADIFNFVILTAILSAANSGLYASGRMLWSLSNERTLPACFARVTKNGVPLTALSVSMLGGVLALFSSVVAPDTVFVALSAI